MTPVRALLILGLDNTEKAFVEIRNEYPLVVRLTCPGNVDLTTVINPIEDVDLITVMCGPQEPRFDEIPDVDVVINAICDADSNARSIASAAAIQRMVGRPVLNAPDLVARTAREGVSELLAGQPGLVVPATARITPRSRADVPAMAAAAGVSPPFIIRPAGAHGGEGLILLDDGERLDDLDRFAFDGTEYCVTRFVDYASPDGLYRKYRVIVIDGAAYARHLVIGRTWKVNAADRDQLMHLPEYDDEERRFLREFDPADFPVFAAIASVLRLDYFGVDYAMDSAGKIVLFEANPCFRVLNAEEAHSLIDAHIESDEVIRAALRRLLLERAGRSSVE